MLKRITALLTAIVMIAVLTPVGLATEAANTYENEYFENFNSSDTIPTSISLATPGRQYMVTDKSAAYKNVVALSSNKGTTEYPTHAVTFNSVAITDGTANSYIETEFDIKPFNIKSADSRYIMILLRSSASSKTGIYTGLKINTNGNVDLYDDNSSKLTAIGKVNMTEWNNIKIVARTTDATGALANVITAIYINGKEVLMDNTENKPYAFFNSIADYSKITIKTNQNKSTFDYEFGAYLDNLSVRTYTSADGKSPVEDMYGFKTAVEAYAQEYASLVETGNSPSDLKNVETAISEARVLYDNEKNTQESLDAAETKIVAAISTFENLPYTTNIYENFNGKTEVPSKIGSTNGHSDIIATGDYFFKDAVKLSSNQGETVWPAHKIDFDDISFATEKTYIEAEFDIKPFNLAQNTRDFTVVLGGADSTRMWALRFFSDGTVYVYNDRDSKTVQQIGKFDIDDWNHIKLVLKTVKTDDVVLCRVDSVFINGEEAPIDDSNKSFFYSDEALSYITFKTNKNEGYSYEFGAYVDNISVRTYTSEDGTSPLSDRYAVIGAAREFYNAKSNIEVSPDKRGYTDEEIAEIGAAIDKLYSYSEYAVLTSSQTAEINAVKAEIYALLEKNAVREIFDEDFEDATNIFNASTQADAGSATENVAVVDSNLSYTLATPVGVTDDLSKLVQWEFDVMVENPATGSVELALQSAGENVEAIEITDSAITMKYNGSFRGASAEKGKWYRIRIVTGEKEGASGNTAFIKEFNINGNDHIIVVENAERNLGSKTQIDSIKLYATNGAKAYIDNVSLKMYYTDTEAPVNKGALIDYIRRGNAALAKAKIGVNILQSIYDTYAAAVSVAKAVYNNEEATQDAVYTATDTLCTAASKYIFKDESVKIGAIEFADASGNAVTAAAKGVYIDKINVTRKADYGDGSIFIAVYDNGVLKQTKILKDVIGSLAVGERIALEVDMLLGDFTHIKAFAFDSLGKLSPIAMPYSPTNGEAKVYVAGDSIVQSYIDTQTKSYYPRQGWGYYLDDYLSQDITVNNLAVSGYTTISYISYGKLNIAEETMNEGDYLLVSFMANDNNKMTASQFKNMLRYYNDVATLHGATAVFITSPKIAYENSGGFNGFCQAMRDVAAELDVTLVDVYDKREKFEEETSLAYVQSSMYLFNLEENFDMTTEQIQENLGSDVVNGKDKTHLSQWGAERVASWITELLQSTDSTLRYYKNDKVYVEPDAYTAG